MSKRAGGPSSEEQETHSSRVEVRGLFDDACALERLDATWGSSVRWDGHWRCLRDRNGLVQRAGRRREGRLARLGLLKGDEIGWGQLSAMCLERGLLGENAPCPRHRRTPDRQWSCPREERSPSARGSSWTRTGKRTTAGRWGRPPTAPGSAADQRRNPVKGPCQRTRRWA